MIFHFREFDIRHRDSLLKVNTDAVLLGAVIQSSKPVKNILDIGTGCGIIALMAAQKYKEAHIDAIDIDQPSLEEAQFNFERSKFSERMTAHHISLQHYKDTKEKFDIILCNPPYFETPQFAKGNNLQDISEKRKKFATHHQLNFGELINAASGLLNSMGQFWVILPYAAKEKFNLLAFHHKLNLQKEVAIRSKPAADFIRCVLCFGLEAKSFESAEIIIYNIDGTRHRTYQEITKEYYL